MTIAETWRQEGRLEGIKEGIQKGMRKGKLEGIRKRNYEVANIMLLKGQSVDLIVEITGLQKTEIAKLKAALPKKH